MSVLQPYFESIFGAVIVFPFVAFLITLPFVIRTYRRYNGISKLRVVIVYTFVLYMLCAFLLTVLPLPSIEAVAAKKPMRPQTHLFRNFIRGTSKRGLDFSDPSTLKNVSAWISYLKSGEFFQIIANCVMLLPLGVYLRYYFRCNFWKTLLAGFFTSLFFEAVQLSGLFFIYPHPYRCADVNDLLTNTIGAVLGYLLARPLTAFLPSRDEIDHITWKKSDRVSLLRQVAAVCVDWLIVGGISCICTLGWEWASNQPLMLKFYPRRDLILIFIYLCLLQHLLKGRTPGKMLLRIRAVNRTEGGKDTVQTPGIVQYMIRYGIIYILYPCMFCLNVLGWGCIAILFLYDNIMTLRMIAICGTLICNGGSLWFIFHCLSRRNRLPHDAYSHIDVVLEEDAI